VKRFRRLLPRRTDEGFSLIELIIAMTFFGMLMLGFLSLFPLGMRSVQKSGKMSIASSLAQDEIERLKALPRTDPDLTAGTHVDAGNPIQGVYSRAWSVTDDVPLAGMKSIDLAVSYTDNGIPRNVQISTYLSR
jgi:prepilin-type N-terminal cleavage/methylation domain-containing protein